MIILLLSSSVSLIRQFIFYVSIFLHGFSNFMFLCALVFNELQLLMYTNKDDVGCGGL